MFSKLHLLFTQDEPQTELAGTHPFSSGDWLVLKKVVSQERTLVLLEVVFPLTVGRTASLPAVPGGLHAEVNLDMYSFFAQQCASGSTLSTAVYVPDGSDLTYVVSHINQDLQAFQEAVA